MSKPLVKRNIALAGEFASLVIKDKELAEAVNGKAVIALPAWDRELALHNLSLVRPENDNVFLLVMPSGRWSTVTHEQAEELFAEGDEALYEHALYHLYLRGKATFSDLAELDPYKDAWREFAKSAYERHVREQREASAFRKAVEGNNEEDRTMVTADEARSLTREATNRDSGTFAGRIVAERRAFTGTWRGRRRLARVRRGIEREARRGGRCVDVLVGPYVRAVALSDYLSDYGYRTVVNIIGNNYEVRVSW